MSRLAPWLLLLPLLACGDSSAESPHLGPGGEAPTPPGASPRRTGPLADAGPDQRALPGMRVRLDGRGTRPSEDARATTYRWVQEAGPGVQLSDPTSPVTEFVAPPLRPGAGHRLVFRLTTFDDAASSRDRVVVEVVEDPALLEHGPVVVAGPDLEASLGETITLPPPSFLDPSCLDEGEPGCTTAPLPHCWTQVQGPRVELLGACGDGPATFEAPTQQERLVFRVDAHRPSKEGAARSCGPEVEAPVPTPPCGAPDYLRVVVGETPRRRAPPSTWWRAQGQEQPLVGLVVLEGKAPELPAQVEISAGAADPGEGWRAVGRFRPLLGRIDGPLRAEPLRLQAPPWPGPVGVAYEPSFYVPRQEGGQTRMEWYAGAPAVALLTWRPPTDLPELRADAGPTPCSVTPQHSDDCEPIAPGETVVLAGAFHGQVEETSPQTCWEQTFGPPIDLLPGGGCLPAAATRRFVAPSPPGDRPLELAFQFSVRDAGPSSSRPATLWLQVRPEDVLPPTLDVDVPTRLAPGASGIVDASQSLDPGGGPLRYRWRQIGGPQVGMRSCDDADELSSGCLLVSPPLDAAGNLSLELQAASGATGLVTSRRIEIPIDEGEGG